MEWRLLVVVGVVSPCALIGAFAGFAAEDPRRPLPLGAVVCAFSLWFVVTALLMLLVTVLDELRALDRPLVDALSVGAPAEGQT